MYGGVSLDELEEMPIDKYLVLRKAVEMDEITRRLTVISDINAAFSGNKKYMQKLEKIFYELSGQKDVTWEADKNWKKRLLRFRR
jgi:hypothetical protein